MKIHDTVVNAGNQSVGMFQLNVSAVYVGSAVNVKNRKKKKKKFGFAQNAKKLVNKIERCFEI